MTILLHNNFFLKKKKAKKKRKHNNVNLIRNKKRINFHEAANEGKQIREKSKELEPEGKVWGTDIIDVEEMLEWEGEEEPGHRSIGRGSQVDDEGW